MASSFASRVGTGGAWGRSVLRGSRASQMLKGRSGGSSRSSSCVQQPRACIRALSSTSGSERGQGRRGRGWGSSASSGSFRRWSDSSGSSGDGGESGSGSGSSSSDSSSSSSSSDDDDNEERAERKPDWNTYESMAAELGEKWGKGNDDGFQGDEALRQAMGLPPKKLRSPEEQLKEKFAGEEELDLLRLILDAEHDEEDLLKEQGRGLGEWTPSKDRKIGRNGWAMGIGRRKTSRAAVWLRPGKGDFTVNNREMFKYFYADWHQDDVIKPLMVTNKLSLFDVNVKVRGGGMSGQAGAVRLGVARALENFDPWLRQALKAEKLLTRDARVVERKKAGRKKARKLTQWTKR